MNTRLPRKERQMKSKEADTRSSAESSAELQRNENVSNTVERK